MRQELHVELKKSPIDIYKKIDELTSEDFLEISKRLYRWSDGDRLDFLNASEEEKRKTIEKSIDRYKNIINDVTKAVGDDVDSFVKSYNYEDCDGMIDYFDVDFYYFGCLKNNGSDVKIVPKTALIKNKSTSPIKKDAKQKKTKTEPEKLEQKTGYIYKITKEDDTRDGSDLWVVRIIEIQYDVRRQEDEIPKRKHFSWNK